MVQKDGKLLAGWNGNFTRLNPDGSVDETYHNRSGGFVYGVFLIQSDGRIIASGSEHIQRFLANGLPDPSFQPLPDDWTVGALQTDDKIIVAGATVARFNADGTLDVSFKKARLQLQPDWAQALSVAVKADEKIIVIGALESVNGRPTGNLVRLNSDGSLDETFDAGAGLIRQLRLGSPFPWPFSRMERSLSAAVSLTPTGSRAKALSA